MPKTSFIPSKHGFHFKNDFVNKIIKVGFGTGQTRGRCGGMAFASLDYYFSQIPVPTHESKDFPDGNVPPDGSILADYIYRRSINSIVTKSSYKFLKWSMSKDKWSNFNSGVPYKTKREEFQKLKKSIDEGKPVVLGLITASRALDICDNHQVVAYGYDYNKINDYIAIYTYDSNFPDEETVIESDDRNLYFASSDGHTYRGFFVQDYKVKKPSYTDLAIIEDIAANKSKCKYKVKNIGQFPANVKHFGFYVISSNKANYGNIYSFDVKGNIILPGEEITVCAKFDEFEGDLLYNISPMYCSSNNNIILIPSESNNLKVMSINII